jgi:pimeloyl-ACP methyl ester carboxylesterase
MALAPDAERWLRAGEHVDFRGHRIYVQRRAGESPTLLFLHGFPSSSFDWRLLLEHETRHAAVVFDFLGFGLSDKPRDHDYTLGWQADLAETMASGPVFLVAHDIGTSVATELMARDLEGRLELDVAGALLLNGSMLQHLAEPTLGQRLLRSPLGPLFARLTSERFFRQQFGSLFSPDHPLSDEEARSQWSLLRHDGGQRLGHKLIAYMAERYRFAERWHGAFRDWPKPLSLAWGLRDPVARPAVLEGLRELRPGVPVTELDDLGHYPQVEDPERLALLVEEAVAG